MEKLYGYGCPRSRKECSQRDMAKAAPDITAVGLKRLQEAWKRYAVNVPIYEGASEDICMMKRYINNHDDVTQRLRNISKSLVDMYIDERLEEALSSNVETFGERWYVI